MDDFCLILLDLLFAREVMERMMEKVMVTTVDDCFLSLLDLFFAGTTGDCVFNA